ncbi:LAME_0F05886g1_1 [Lachancea meyersii CBS 8951]|uniref:tRNA-5-taurinomethyluridine 2-sulfurtransferase n=1 Tax=Lachancea meyersii CBS 8951 TaxID=1266667 RepID=A0A1G4JT19_9SACH|nr:LAME_0F05886g1_1 [Lachancea meyersii CBS 8951]
MDSTRCLTQLLKFSALKSRQLPGYGSMKLPGKFDNIVIAMSSGVDSSVAAAMFAGFPKAQGVYMQNWSASEANVGLGKERCHERDWKDVEKVASHLGLPVDRVNFEQDYWQDVFEPMLQGYQLGITPNPDIGCNKFIKFGRLRTYLDSKLGNDNYWLVTGHYAQVLPHISTGESHLLRAFYKPKDQSYYLSQIPRSVLPQLCLPMGALTKPEVRKMASEIELPTATKRDSQGICFVANSQHNKFKKFLQQYLPKQPGNIVTVGEEDGSTTVWGQHTGLWNYTIGQKIGISMPQGDPRYSGAWFVAQKLQSFNEIVICRGRDNPKLFANRLVVSGFEPLGDSVEMGNILEDNVSRREIFIQYRSLQEPIVVSDVSMQISGSLCLTLSEAQRAMAPGQYCTIYHKERILGSGIIKSTAQDGEQVQ